MVDGENLVWGWQSSPNNRGTLDIVFSCILTIVLCSWSCVCLNMPAPDMTKFGSFIYRMRWQLFTIVFPEITTSVAAEQWESANQSVTKFASLGHGDLWTRKHAFFTDMGGVHLRTPDFQPFPIDSQQLAYLVENKYLTMPNITLQDISDRNKADGMARVLVVLQLVWFSVQCLGRWAQGLGLTTLELSTLAFILCTLNIYFFWYHKPLDIQTPIIVHTEHTMAFILSNAGQAASLPYSRTPMDFAKSPIDDRSLTLPFWIGVNSIHRLVEDGGRRPIRYFANHQTMPPDGITVRERIYGVFFELVYFGLHFLGLLLEFPSRTERLLWLSASVTLTALLVVYLVGIYIGHKIQARVGLWLYGRETSSIAEISELLPRWSQIAMHGTVLVIYVVARGYVLVESFLSLRALPAAVYQCVQWTNFLPHL